MFLSLPQQPRNPIPCVLSFLLQFNNLFNVDVLSASCVSGIHSCEWGPGGNLSIATQHSKCYRAECGNKILLPKINSSFLHHFEEDNCISLEDMLLSEAPNSRCKIGP